MDLSQMLRGGLLFLLLSAGVGFAVTWCRSSAWPA